MKHLLAGVGRSDITPAPGTPQAGWGAQVHQRGLGADLPLYATALVVSDGQRQIAVVDADLTGLDSSRVDHVIAAISNLTEIPRACIRFSCSHTHSGPNNFRLQVISEGLDMIVSYLEALPLRIAGAVWQAQHNMRPVRFATRHGHCDIAVNRRLRLADGGVVIGRNPHGAVDHTVRVLRFDDLDERPLATLIHYACHPTTMGWDNEWFTPDYPGMVRAVVEKHVGGTCLFLQGAAGNVMPRRGFTGDLSIYHHWGTILGLEAAKLACSIETLPRREHLASLVESGTIIAVYEDEPVEPDLPRLDVCFRTVRLPLRPQPPPDELDSREASLREQLMRIRDRGSKEEIRKAMALAVQAGMDADRSRLYHQKSHIEWPLQIIRLGNVCLLSIPGEPFIELAQRIVAESPIETWVSGYSNGGFGYLPTREAFEEGGYEVDTSIFGPDAGDIFVRAALADLTETVARTSV